MQHFPFILITNSDTVDNLFHNDKDGKFYALLRLFRKINLSLLRKAPLPSFEVMVKLEDSPNFILIREYYAYKL